MARGLRGAIRRGVAATMVTGLATFGAVAFTVAPASAHSANVHGTAECFNGNYIVKWTITNEDKDHDADLKYTVWPEKSKLALDDELGAGEKIVGFQRLPEGATGTAKIKVDGVWEDDPEVKTEWVEVPLPAGPCGKEKPDHRKPAPTAEITLDCDELEITLSNKKGTKKAEFTVHWGLDDKWYEDGPYYVNPGETYTLPNDGESGEEHKVLKVVVKAYGKKLASAEQDWSECEEPTEEPTEEPSASPSQVAEVPSAEPSNAAEEGSLPVTGAGLTGLIAAAMVVLGAGVAMVFFARRRKQA